MLRNFFNLNTNLIFYIEGNYLILCGFLGIIKIKKKLLLNFFIKKNLLFSYYFYRSITLFLNNIVVLINYGYSNKFKIIGVGYRQFYDNNLVVYKLRYSHLIYNILPLNILSFKKHKKKKFYTLFGLNKNDINKMLHIWLSYRVPNVYTKKGFFKQNKIINFKKITKKLL